MLRRTISLIPNEVEKGNQLEMRELLKQIHGYEKRLKLSEDLPIKIETLLNLPFMGIF